MKKISIIIPSYNSGSYIAKCLSSVLNQNYNNKEIIVIDDGSNDGSLKLVREIEKKYDFVKVFVTRHVGSNGARKMGLEKATGDYVMFVDADDFLMDGAIQTLMERIEKNNVDVVRFGADYYPNGGKVLPIEEIEVGEKIIDHNKIISLLTNGYTLNSLWGKIYKRDLLNNICAFKYDVDLGEDLLVNAEIFEHLDKMLIISDSLYCYRNNNNSSITHNIKKQRIVKNVLDRIFVSSKMLKFIDKNVSNDEDAMLAVYKQLEAVWEVMKRLASIDDYKKEDFEADFKDNIARLKLSRDDEKKLNYYIAMMGILEKLKNGLPVKAIGKMDSDRVWKSFRRYRFLRKIIKRGK